MPAFDPDISTLLVSKEADDDKRALIGKTAITPAVQSHARLFRRPGFFSARSAGKALQALGAP